MPSREEIAGWLREMEQEYKEIADDIRGPFRGPVLKDQIKWGKRAKQIENMSCVMCRHYKVVSIEPYYRRCDLTIESPSSDFGCFSWEAKEDSNHER